MPVMFKDRPKHRALTIERPCGLFPMNAAVV